MAWTVTMMNPKRYEICFADLNPTLGIEISKVRPVVIISDEAMNTHLETVVVCPLTSKIHPAWRTRLQITCAGKPAEIAVDQIRTISKTRLRQKIDRLSPAQAPNCAESSPRCTGSRLSGDWRQGASGRGLPQMREITLADQNH